MAFRVEEFTKRNSRIYLFFYVFAALFLVLIASAAYRQIILHEDYIKKSERQSLRRIIKPGARGNIYDRNNNLLVGNRPRFSAAVYFNDIRKEFREEYARLKKEVRERGESWNSEVAKKLTALSRENVLNSYVAKINEILKEDFTLNKNDFKKHFEQRTLLPLPIVKDLDEKQYAILSEKLPIDSPIQIYTDSCRYYPFNEYAVHALGFVGSDFETDSTHLSGGNLRTYYFADKKGRDGLEKSFDDYLRGQSGAQILVVDPNGYTYETLESVSPRKGKDLKTSLDIRLQKSAEDAMAHRKGAVVALDVKSGEVLVLASRPSYDGNDLTPLITYEVDGKIREKGAWLNRAIKGLYPPGSTFKIITAVAGLEANTLNIEEPVNCQGSLLVGNRNFPCHKRSGHGEVCLAEAIARSCNVFFYNTGLNATIESISAAARMFGLDKKTGIELPSEEGSRTIVPDKKYKQETRQAGPWLNGDTANTSIGQGYLLQTPLQMACFTASFARGQTLTKPSIIYNAGRRTDAEYHGAKKLPISDDEYNKIIEGMIGTVEFGTARTVHTDLAQVAAKSGTAQIMSEGKPLTLAWMIAFAPAIDPEIAIAVVIEGEEPGDASGGKTAGPVVKKVFEEYFKNKNFLQ